MIWLFVEVVVVVRFVVKVGSNVADVPVLVVFVSVGGCK